MWWARRQALQPLLLWLCYSAALPTSLLKGDSSSHFIELLGPRTQKVLQTVSVPQAQQPYISLR